MLPAMRMQEKTMKEQDESKEKVRFLFDGDVTAEKIFEAIKAQMEKTHKKDERGIPIPTDSSDANGSQGALPTSRPDEVGMTMKYFFCVLDSDRLFPVRIEEGDDFITTERWDLKTKEWIDFPSGIDAISAGGDDWDKYEKTTIDEINVFIVNYTAAHPANEDEKP